MNKVLLINNNNKMILIIRNKNKIINKNNKEIVVGLFIKQKKIQLLWKICILNIKSTIILLM